MGCLECRLSMDALLFELQKNITVHKLAREIRHSLCPILPNSYHEGCDDFLHLYASTIVYMTFKQFDSQFICTKAHFCTAETYRTTSLVKSYKDMKHLKCESCKVISKLVVTEIAKQEFRADLIEDIKHQVCERLPSSLLYICENLTKSYVPGVLTRLLQKMDDDTICYILHACH